MGSGGSVGSGARHEPGSRKDLSVADGRTAKRIVSIGERHRIHLPCRHRHHFSQATTTTTKSTAAMRAIAASCCCCCCCPAVPETELSPASLADVVLEPPREGFLVAALATRRRDLQRGGLRGLARRGRAAPRFAPGTCAPGHPPRLGIEHGGSKGKPWSRRRSRRRCRHTATSPICSRRRGLPPGVSEESSETKPSRPRTGRGRARGSRSSARDLGDRSAPPL